MKIGILLLFFAVTLAVACHCETNALEQAILAFPNISASEFQPDQAVQSANILINAGRDPACAVLEKMANRKSDLINDSILNQKICHLCRLIFTPRVSSETLRAPALGAPELLPLESMSSQDWPYMPFAIVNEVPLSMTHGYLLGGRAELSADYLHYCMANGLFRARAFPEPTDVTASNALNQVFFSAAWKTLKWKDSGPGWSYSLSEDHAKEILWKQVHNMAPRPAEQIGAGHSSREPNQMPPDTDPRR